jgi:hypothetical protein
LRTARRRDGAGRSGADSRWGNDGKEKEKKIKEQKRISLPAFHLGVLTRATLLLRAAYVSSFLSFPYLRFFSNSTWSRRNGEMKSKETVSTLKYFFFTKGCDFTATREKNEFKIKKFVIS